MTWQQPSEMEWVRGWSDLYVPGALEMNVFKLIGQPSFNLQQTVDVTNWKFQRLWPGKREKALRAFEKRVGSSAIRGLTTASFACSDDLVAALMLTALPEIGFAAATALLTAHDPARFTVMDMRALASVKAIRLLTTSNTTATPEDWMPYLKVCRDLAHRVGRPLRTVDNALYTANGARGLPCRVLIVRALRTLAQQSPGLTSFSIQHIVNEVVIMSNGEQVPRHVTQRLRRLVREGVVHRRGNQRLLAPNPPAWAI